MEAKEKLVKAQSTSALSDIDTPIQKIKTSAKNRMDLNLNLQSIQSIYLCNLLLYKIKYNVKFNIMYYY